MPEERFDVAIIGLGGMGSAAAAHLAGRGIRVCGFDRFAPAHDRGSSHGRTRIIRKAYFEHPDYVPLLHRAYSLWEELESETDATLFRRCGFLTVGPEGCDTIRGLQECYRRHDLPRDRFDAAALRERFPQFRLAADAVGFFDPLGGFLRVEECVSAHIDRARRLGATLRFEEEVRGWADEPPRRGAGPSSAFLVTTDRRRVAADRLVLATGAWAAPELRTLGIDVEVWRKVQLWYGTPETAGFLPHRFPTFYVETDSGHYYGFPAESPDDAYGVKVAEHSLPEPISDPSRVDRQLRREDEARVRGFVDRTLPALGDRCTHHAVCMYTMTPDETFVVDRHPRHAGVVLAAGFSGHGFKFAPVIGEALADLILEGRTDLPIEFLGLRRFDGADA